MQLKKPFRVARAEVESKTNYFISIDNQCFGEAASSVFYGPDEREIKSDLEKGREFLESLNNLTINSLNEIDALNLNTISKSAIIGVMLHHLSKNNKTYPWQLLNLDKPAQINTSFTVSIDKPDRMYNEIVLSSYPIIKIKMGFDGDELLLNELGKISGKLFRIDANGGWSPDKAEKMLFYADKQGVDIVEQPTDIKFISDWKYIKNRSKVHMILDEGLSTIDDYYRYCDNIDGINIKMSKSGGIIEAIKIARQAKKDKMKIMLGCMVESSVGISQAVYLSSLADFFDLDGPLLLKNDIAIGINFDLDKITVNEDINGGPKIKKEYRDDNNST